MCTCTPIHKTQLVLNKIIVIEIVQSFSMPRMVVEFSKIILKYVAPKANMYCTIEMCMIQHNVSVAIIILLYKGYHLLKMVYFYVHVEI